MKILGVILMIPLAGCYTVVKQSGNYYEEFRPTHAVAEVPDDSTMIEDSDTSYVPDYKPVIINNYVSAPEYYDPWYYRGWGYYPGWSVSYGYYGATWWYDPYWDPNYYYYGWCHYPSVYDPSPAPAPSENTRRTFGGRQYTFSGNTTPGTLLPVSLSGNRTYGAAASNKVEIDEERVRRNYRKIYGIDDNTVKRETPSNGQKTERKTETRSERPREVRATSTRAESGSTRREGRASSGRSSGERNSGRKYKN